MEDEMKMYFLPKIWNMSIHNWLTWVLSFSMFFLRLFLKHPGRVVRGDQVFAGERLTQHLDVSTSQRVGERMCSTQACQLFQLFQPTRYFQGFLLRFWFPKPCQLKNEITKNQKSALWDVSNGMPTTLINMKSKDALKAKMQTIYKHLPNLSSRASAIDV